MPESTRISQLSAHDAKPADNDLFILTDVSDDTQSAEGSTKKITYQNLTSSLTGTVSLPQSATWDTAYTTVTANSATWASGTGETSGLGVVAYGSVQQSAGNSSLVHKSDNVDSVIRNGTGDYTIKFNTSLTDYNVNVNTRGSSVTSAFIGSKSSSSFTVRTRRLDHANNVAIADIDAHFDFIVVNKDANIVSGSSTTPQFCNVLGLSSTQNISHDTGLNINFDGDLSTGSQNWRTYNTDLGVNVIEPGEAGYYNIHAGTRIVGTTSNSTMNDVQYADLHLYKYNKTSQTATSIISKYIGKAVQSGWVLLEPHVTQHNYYLAADEVLYVMAYIWKQSNTGLTQQKLHENSANTFIQVERSAVGTTDSGTGAFSSNSTISDNLSFSYNFPDALLVPLTRGGGYQERIFPFVGVTNNSATSLSGVWSDGIFSYELGLGSERFILIFDNDTNGTFNSYTETGDTATTDVVWSEMSPATTNQPTLKEFIDAGRAIYYK